MASLAPSTSSIREAWEEAAGRNRDTSLVLRPLCIHQHQLSLQVMCLTPPLPNNPASTLHQSDKTKNKGIKNVTCQLPMSGQSGQMALGRWFSQMVTDTHCRVLSHPPSPLVTLRTCKKDFYENIPKRRTDNTEIRETGVVKSG